MEFFGLTLTAWSSLVGALSIAILACIMLILGNQRLHFIWAVFCVTVFIYAGGFYVVTITNSPDSAHFWWKIEYIGTILIPFIFFHFILEFIGRARLWIIVFLYLVGMMFVYVDLTTNLIIDRVTFMFGELYYNHPPASLHPYFLAFYIVFVLVGFYLLFTTYRSSKDPLFRTQARYLFIGMGVGFLGGSMNFLPIYGIKVHPSTNLTLILGTSIIAYAILRYQLFNIRVVTAQFLTLIIVSFAVIRLIISNSVQEAIFNILLLVVTLVIGIYLIISVRKEVEQREQIEKMAKELQRAYVIEKKAKEELQKIDRIKDQFLLTTQHDLRNPLTSVKWFLDMMLRGVLGKQNKKTMEGAKRIQDSVENSIEQINSFLDIAQFQMGKSGVILKPGIELLPILDSIFNRLKTQAEEKGIYLKFNRPEENFKVEADATKLKAAITNIIDNAVKYTIKGGVTISIKYQASSNKNGNSVLIEVKDTGIGIPKDKVSAIFENMFERTEGAKKTSAVGKGIGLYLSSQVIKSHNGKAWAESEGEGKGSTFYVELPID